jgi:DNA-binding transcriptional LysR family regulator
MDYVETLRLFRAVVEGRSFTRAADTLGVTTPVVSRAIASLEQRLGTRLFHRTTRQISMTETAERFYDGCTRMAASLPLAISRTFLSIVELAVHREEPAYGYESANARHDKTST